MKVMSIHIGETVLGQYLRVCAGDLVIVKDVENMILIDGFSIDFGINEFVRRTKSTIHSDTFLLFSTDTHITEDIINICKIK